MDFDRQGQAENDGGRPEKSGGGKKRRFVGILAMAVLLSLMWRGLQRTSSSTDGAVPESQNDSRNLLHPEQASTLQVNSEWITISSSGSMGDARMPMGSAAMFVFSDDAFTLELGEAVANMLREKTGIPEIPVLHNEALPLGEQLPDMLLSVSREKFDVSGASETRQIEATFLIGMSDVLRRSSHSVHHSGSPSLVSFQWYAKMDASIDQQKQDVPSADAQLQQRLASEIAEKCHESLSEQWEKYGTRQADVDLFYPEYVPTPDWALLKHPNLELLFSGRRQMTPNRSMWRIPSPEDIGPLLEEAAAELRNEGWSTVSISEGRLYATRNYHEETLQIFRDGDGSSPGAITKEQPDYFVDYERLMSHDAITDAMRQLIQQSPTEEQLVEYSRFWYRVRDEVDQFFEAHPPKRAESMVNLAKHSTGAGRLEEAREWLLRAHMLDLVYGKRSSSLRELSEELGMGSLPESPDPELLLRGNLVHRLSDLETPFELKVGETAIIYLGEAQGEQTYLLMTPEPLSANTSIREQYRRFQNHAQSLSTTSYPLRNGRHEKEVPSDVQGERQRIVIEQADPESVFTLRLLEAK